MKKYLNKDVIVLILIYIVLAASTGVYFPFNALYLAGTINLSSSQISFMDGTGQLAAMFFLPLVGILSDKSKSPSLTIIFLMIGTSLFMLIYASLSVFSAISIMYIAFLMFRRGIFPLIDSLALNVCANRNLNFGVFRSIYSASFMLCAILVGLLFKNQTKIDNSFIYLSIVFNVIVIILCLFAPKIKLETHEKTNLKKDFKMLLKNKNFIYTSIGVGLIMASISIVSMYNSIIIVDLGGDLNDVGLSSTMQMLPEVFLGVFAMNLIKKHQRLKIIYYSSIIVLLRWILNSLFYSFNFYYYSIWIEGFATIFILILGMDYIRSIVKDNLISTSITLYTSITLFFYFVFVNLCAFFMDSTGLKSIFYVLVVIVLLGMFFIRISVNNCEKPI